MLTRECLVRARGPAPCDDITTLTAVAFPPGTTVVAAPRMASPLSANSSLTAGWLEGRGGS